MSGRRRSQKKLKNGIYIVGEGITEQYYFLHLKKIKQYNCIVKPRLFRNTSIDEMEKAVDQLLLADAIAICVFDADVARRNEKEKIKLISFKKKFNRNKNVLICDSFPSIEFWFLLHFLKSCKHFQNSGAVEKELQKFITNYKKTGQFLEQTNWVENLIPKMETAIENAKKCSEDLSYSNIFKAISKISN